MLTKPALIPVLTCLLVFALAMVCVPPRQTLAAMPPVKLVIVYKNQKVMQLLSGNEVIRSYQVALGRNPLGRKQKAGDCRTPEGTYIIDCHKKDSKFYKALHISYPNKQDLAVARNHGQAPGGDIMIHGLPKGFEDLADFHYRKNWTKGCIAVNNTEMDEIWQMVADGTPIIIKP